MSFYPRRKYLREICDAIYMLSSSGIIINNKLRKCLGAKIVSMLVATKKGPSYRNKTLGRHEWDFRTGKQSLSVIVHRDVNHLDISDSLFTPARLQWETRSTHVVSACRPERIDRLLSVWTDILWRYSLATGFRIRVRNSSSRSCWAVAFKKKKI